MFNKNLSHGTVLSLQPISALGTTESAKAGARLPRRRSQLSERSGPGKPPSRPRSPRPGPSALGDPSPSRVAQTWAAQGGAAGRRRWGGAAGARPGHPRGTGEARRPHPALGRNGPGGARRRRPAGRRLALHRPTPTPTPSRDPGPLCARRPRSHCSRSRSRSRSRPPRRARSGRDGPGAQERPRHVSALPAPSARVWPLRGSTPPSLRRPSSPRPRRCAAR